MVVVVINELGDEIIQVSFAESNEMVQTFILDRLHESFDTGIQIWRTDRQAFRLDAIILQKLTELSGKLRIPIVKQIRRFLLAVGNVVRKRFGLLRHPSGIGIPS